MDEKLVKLIKFLDHPDRIRKLPAESLLKLLPLRGDENLLDIGSGTGYLTLPAAKKTRGSVFAYDIEPKLLNIIKERAEIKEITNIEYVEGRIEELPPFIKPINVVLTSLILHEIENLQKALKNIHQTLVEEGHLLIVEYEIEKYSSEEPPRISSKKMIDELKKARFNIIKKQFPAVDVYVILAKKK